MFHNIHLETVFRSFAVAMKRTFVFGFVMIFLGGSETRVIQSFARSQRILANLAKVEGNSKVMINKG